MRKRNILNKRIQWSLLIMLVFLAACKKDELMSKELLVYVPGEYGSINNSVTASLTQTPTAVWGTTSFQMSVYATREVVADVNVSVAANDPMVAKFNTDNGRKSVLLPASAYTLNSPDHKITAGTAVSDPIKIDITNAKSLTDTNGYVLPLTITKVGSEDKGVQISSNRSTVYLYVPYQYTNVDSVQTVLTGTSMARTAWSITVSNTTSGALGPAMIDGSNTTAWRSSNSTTAVKWAVINMGSQQTIKGFQMVPNYVAVAENATQMTVSTSNDNVTYTVQGIWKGTGPSATSTATSPDIKGINFITPIKAQYFRFDITALVSGGRVGIGEIYAIQ